MSYLLVSELCALILTDSFSASVSFSKRGFSVRSFGTGTHVKLPGPAPDKPNVYDFKTTYDQMYNDLLRKDKELYPSGCPFTNPTRWPLAGVICDACITLTSGLGVSVRWARSGRLRVVC